MTCFVSLPLPNQCMELPIDPKQTGQVVLDKVLERLGVLEVDYFGLQYKGAKGEDLWLNLRNRVCDHELQLHSVYRLSLRVKFFVPPHLLQQEPTRELYYTQIKDCLTRGLLSVAEPYCDEIKLTRIVAALAQTEYGDKTLYQNVLYEEIIKTFCPGVKSKTTLLEQIALEHSRLTGVPRVSARNFVLKEVSTLPGYGVEEHKTINSQGNEVNFQVGPDGITIHDKSQLDRVIPYTQIRLATHNEKLVYIELLDDSGEPHSEECFKLVSRKAAVALYRCITEMHSFYRCDTICSNVQSQYSRDFKGTFVSIFNENSDFGKRYMFDIQRTSREAYDLVRRKLYAKSSGSNNNSPVHSLLAPPTAKNDENGNVERLQEAAGDVTLEERYRNLEMQNKQLQQRLEAVEDLWLCCICMFRKVTMVLCPCGHMVCEMCSEHINSCPQCRTTIESFQRVYQCFGGDSPRMITEEVV